MTLNQRQVIDQWRGTEEHWDALIGVICIIGIVACVPELKVDHPCVRASQSARGLS